MNGNLTWTGMKKELWKQDKKDLLKHLEDLERHKIQLESELRHGSKKRIAFHSVSKAGVATRQPFFKIKDLSQVKKRIACIKTMLNVKFGKYENHGIKNGTKNRL